MRILFINHSTQNCGVADYGRRLYVILKTGMDIDYCDGLPDYSGYDVALYNYHHATMPTVNKVLGVKHVALFHEAFMNAEFDKVIPVEQLARPLMSGYQYMPLTSDPKIIGSFGFGFPSKNFPGLAQMVKEQFEKAVLRLSIPFAQFGDADGSLARGEADKCRELLAGTQIELQVSHAFLRQDELLSWCRTNDLNAFLYHPSAGRGISSCIDYALSVKRPIAVSNSEMFRHLPAEICVDNNTLPRIIAQSLRPLTKVYEENSNENLIEQICRQLEISSTPSLL